MKCTIRIIWDDEARVWYTDSIDMPIFLNDASYDGLIERVRVAAPETLEESNGYIGPIDLIFESVRVEKALAS